MYDKTPEKEIALVRGLAARISEYARTPEMAAIRKRWRDSVEMRPNTPPVWCNPVGCWKELLPPESLACRTPELRELEEYFKRLLIKKDIGDDTPVSDVYDISPVLLSVPANEWGLDIRTEKLDADGSAWRYLPALESEEDFDRLAIPRYHYDIPETERRRELYQSLLGDAMTVRINPLGSYFSAATICLQAAWLRGMEPMMMDMILDPGLVRRLMATISRGVLNRLDAVESSPWLFPNTESAMLMSDPLRPGGNEKISLKDCWIHGNSQEFDQVSPEMFEEFLFAWQKPIFERFGAVCYGCCENLTHKLDPILALPNLKLLTCSAWTDLPTLVDKAGGRCCIMWRHKASDVVCPHDLKQFAADIKEQADQLSGCHYQVVLRELQTLMGHPGRLREWTDLCRDIVN